MIYVYRQEIDGVWFAGGLENERVFATSFSTNEEAAMQSIAVSLPRNVPFKKNAQLSIRAVKLLNTLKTAFEGKDVASTFQIALDHLPAYTRSVLECVSVVPIGYVTTYGAVAKVSGAGPRAVGQAVASNPVPLLIPCHRVVRADFSLGGYGMGERMKLLLLQRENKQYLEAKKLNMNEKVLSVFPKVTKAILWLEINTREHNQ